MMKKFNKWIFKFTNGYNFSERERIVQVPASDVNIAMTVSFLLGCIATATIFGVIYAVLFYTL